MSEPALAQGAAARDIPFFEAKNSGVTRPEQLFLRPYGNSRGADRYARYLRAPGEGGAIAHGSQNQADSVHRRPFGAS